MSGESWAPSLGFSDEQKMLEKTAQQFVQSRAPVARLRSFRHAKDWMSFSRDIWSEMAELGWLGLQIPQEYDGLGLDFFDLCVVLEQSGRELMPEPFVSTLLLGAQALLLGGTDAQKREFLPSIVNGETVMALAYGELQSCGDVGVNMQTVAHRSSGGFELTGEKTNVLDGHLADQMIVFARVVGERQDTIGHVFAMIDPKQPGVQITRQIRMDGHHAAIVRLEKVCVPTDQIIGSIEEGTALLQQVLDHARVGLSAHMLGGAEQTFVDTLAYIKEREQFGVPIGSFQVLQHRAVDLYIELVLMRSVVFAAARAIDEASDQVPRLASLAKAIASETFLHVAEEAIQMHGGIGVTDEHDIGLYIKRAQSTYVILGEPSLHRRRWAEFNGY